MENSILNLFPSDPAYIIIALLVLVVVLLILVIVALAKIGTLNLSLIHISEPTRH